MYTYTCTVPTVHLPLWILLYNYIFNHMSMYIHVHVCIIIRFSSHRKVRLSILDLLIVLRNYFVKEEFEVYIEEQWLPFLEVC